MNYSGFWRRVGAYVVDGVILSVIFFVLSLILQAVGVTMYENIESTTQVEGLSAEAGVSADLSTGGTIFLILFVIFEWLYFAKLESSARQATIGKMALGIRVTGLNGERISFARATGRFFAKILSALILGIGFLMAAFTAHKQALHDMIAGTLVLHRPVV